MNELVLAGLLGGFPPEIKGRAKDMSGELIKEGRLITIYHCLLTLWA